VTAPRIELNGVKTTSGTVSSSPYQITLAGVNAGTSSDRVLLVGVQANYKHVVSVTFGGAQLTKKVATFFNNDDELWYLTSPNGTGDIVVTMNGPTSVVVGAYSFSGVDQVNPLPTTATRHSIGLSSPKVSITTASPDDWVVDSASIWGGVTLASPTCTPQWDINLPSRITGASSLTFAPLPGTVNCGWTASSGDQWDEVAVELKVSP